IVGRTVLEELAGVKINRAHENAVIRENFDLRHFRRLLWPLSNSRERPFRVNRCTAASRRTIMRKPSCLISWIPARTRRRALGRGWQAGRNETRNMVPGVNIDPLTLSRMSQEYGSCATMPIRSTAVDDAIGSNLRRPCDVSGS